MMMIKMGRYVQKYDKKVERGLESSHDMSNLSVERERERERDETREREILQKLTTMKKKTALSFVYMC